MIDKVVKKQLQVFQKKMVDTEKNFQSDEKKFQEQTFIVETLQNRIEEIIENREAFDNTLYILSKELENEQLKSRLRTTASSGGGASPRKQSPSKFNYN